MRRRPTWGYAWSNLAEASLYAGDRPDLTLVALDRAMALAPFEPDTQRKALLVGFLMWDHLGEPRRSAVRAAIRRAKESGVRADELIRLAVQSNRTGELAELLDDPEHRKLLESLGSERNLLTRPSTRRTGPE